VEEKEICQYQIQNVQLAQLIKELADLCTEIKNLGDKFWLMQTREETIINEYKGDPTYNVRMLVETSIEHVEEIRQSELKSIEKQMTIHIENINRLIEAEAKRIDAIRVIDTNAVAIASEKAASQAEVLANQLVASTESLRVLVASTNASIAQQLTQISTQLTERITLLEKVQYENQGRSGISTPLLMLIAGLVGGLVVFIVQQLMI
jgi:DNA recombination-dependent growth factor C